LSDGCIINADYDNVYQIFYNIVENAIKYSGQDNEVKVLLFLRDNDVVFIVDDYGEGIPEKDLKKVFDRFYRVDKARARATGGTGLGLSIVAAAVEQCGGIVSAENRPGGGARFTVKFPKSDRPLPERRDLI
jgi:signal transduction histidine kinase